MNKTPGKRRFEEIGINIDEEHLAKKTNMRTKIKSAKVFESLLDEFDEKKAIEDLVNSAPEMKQIDVGTLIGLVQTLEKAALKNSQMRAKYENSPKKFMQSEVDLADSIKAMNEITVAPSLYAKLVQQNFITIVFSLLSHENTDIVIETINLLTDLLDPSTILEEKEALVFLESAEENNIFDLVVKNLERLAESEEDSNGLFNALSIFENLMEMDLKYLLGLLIRKNLIKFLIVQIQSDKFKDQSNRFYSAELLATFINLAPELCAIYVELGVYAAIDSVVQEITQTSSLMAEKSEFVNNLLDVLATISVVESRQKIMTPSLMKALFAFIKKKRFKCRRSALNLLSACLINAPENIVMFIEEGGLKTIFFEFMRRTKNIKSIKNKTSQKISNLLNEEDDILEHIAIVFVQCFLHLKDVNYLRFLKKFEEKDNEKVDKLIELFDHYYSKVEEMDKKLAGDKKLENFTEKKKYLFRFNKGGYMASLIAVIIALLCSAGEGNIRKRVLQVLSQHDMSKADIKSVLSEYRSHIEGEDVENKPIGRDIVENLLKLIDS